MVLPTVCKAYLSVLMIAFGIYAGTFSVQGTKIYDPNGNEFIPIGTNVVGWNYYGWANNTVSYANAIEQAWKFNIVRANINLKQGLWNNQYFGTTWVGHETECQNALDAIINAYTAKGIVVMLEVHDWTGTFPYTTDLTLLNDFYKGAINRYKNNTYVWFNVMNEPQWNSSNPVVDPYWVTVHQKIISLARDTLGASNIIICDGVQCGQEAYSWNNDPVYEGYSAILTYGASVKQFNSKTYQNIAFSFHCYDEWGYNNQQFDAKMADFIDRIHAKGHCVMVGEVGARSATDLDYVQTTGTVYRVCVPRKVGFLAWHYEAADAFTLLSSGGNGSGLNSWTNPTNLSTYFGSYFWKVVHTDGWGLSTLVLAITAQPADVTVTVGAVATFTITASGSPEAYQWQSAPAGSSTFTNVSGAVSASYTTPATTTAMNRMQYRCVATKSASSVTSTVATLTVNAVVTTNKLPYCALTAPANGVTYKVGSLVAINATATDTDGTIAKVEFFAGSTKIGEDLSAPYVCNWTGSTAGTFVLTAKATDNAGGIKTSAGRTVYVNKRKGIFIAPTVTTVSTSQPVTLAATTTSSGSLAKAAAGTDVVTNDSGILYAEFFINGVKIAVDSVAPFSTVWESDSAGEFSATAVLVEHDGSRLATDTLILTVQSPTAVLHAAAAMNKHRKAGYKGAGLSVYVPCWGSYTVALYDMRGSVIERKSASSPQLITFSKPAYGMNIVSVRQGSEEAIIKTMSH